MNTRPLTALSLSISLSLLCAFGARAEQAPASAPAEATASATAAASATDSGAPAAAPETPPAPQLGIKEVKPGKGREATPGHDVEVHYTGWLQDLKVRDGRGKKFDSSLGRGLFRFPLGGGRVIKGWELGVAGMKEGGKRTLTIPPELAYGKRNIGNGLIPPDSTLIFDVELVKVHD
ncbi:FKBP-type peptidyl-prolyl cis-trans isomerase [Massilia sp. W12]|uniref:FKBP-type peptidyl-prolyl cis-trans isomerase n=1 Tax=Massilia sp. W12 TaxID=3126507 RepID=UPI0030D1B41F